MISVVIPLLNEEESLPELFIRLLENLKKLKKEYEIIFVDDGSTDNSLNLLKAFEKEHKKVRIFSFRRHQGKSEALDFGLHKSNGDIIVTLDADLQDRPEEIENLLKKIEEGLDVVSGWRKNRQDKWHMKIASKIFNKIVEAFWGANLHDYNCGLKAYRKEAAKTLHLYGGMYRFIPLLCIEQGFEVGEIVVEHDKRKFGKSKYGFSKIKDLPDMLTILFLTRYGKRPLHFFGMIGGLFLLVGIIFLSYLTYLHFFYGTTVGTRPLWSIGSLFIVSGFQIIFTGFIADLVINLSQRDKSYDAFDTLRYASDKK